MTRDTFKAACIQFLGIPYKWGGDDTILGFDCSGLIQELYSMIGLDPRGDQTAQALYDHFIKLPHNDGILECGALIFYGRSLDRISHVAMILDEGSCIEAGGGGSKTNTSKDAADQNAYIRVRPWNRRHDVVAVICPKALPWLAI